VIFSPLQSEHDVLRIAIILCEHRIFAQFEPKTKTAKRPRKRRLILITHFVQITNCGTEVHQIRLLLSVRGEQR
jgi:hypothetical protein